MKNENQLFGRTKVLLKSLRLSMMHTRIWIKGVAVAFLLLCLLTVSKNVEATSGAEDTNPPTGITSSDGVYTQNSGTVTKTGQTYSSSSTDVSAITVTGGTFSLSGSKVTTSGNTSSGDKSSFDGLNAGILAKSDGIINLLKNKITTVGTGANGVFSYGNSKITMLGDTVVCSGRFAHAIMCSGGGTITGSNLVLTTSGANSGAIATDRGSGAITVKGAVVTTSGADAPGLYSTGVLTVSDATIKSIGSEVAVIEGANSIILNNSSLISTKEGKWGVFIMQSMSGDAEGDKGIFTMTGGSLSYKSKSGPLFFITNSTGTITLKGVNVSAASGELVKASSDKWGRSGSNGGNAKLTADGQSLTGNLTADKLSSLAVTLQNNSSLTGGINTGNTANSASLTLSANSSWTLTADSYLSSLSDAATNFSNITTNGHKLYVKGVQVK
jgi:hypothetical protein